MLINNAMNEAMLICLLTMTLVILLPKLMILNLYIDYSSIVNYSCYIFISFTHFHKQGVRFAQPKVPLDGFRQCIHEMTGHVNNKLYQPLNFKIIIPSILPLIFNCILCLFQQHEDNSLKMIDRIFESIKFDDFITLEDIEFIKELIQVRLDIGHN